MKTQFTNLLKTTASLSIIMGLAFSQSALAASAPVLEIKNFIGTIDVQTGDFDEITVTDADGAPIEHNGQDVLIDAGYKIDNAHCKSSNANVKISIGKWRYSKRSGGFKNLKEYPSLKITAPRNTHLNISKSVVFGDVGEIGSGDIRISSCGDLDFEDVMGALNIDIRGSGDVSIGNAGSTEISISGSGDLTTQNLASVDVSINGSGDLEIGDVTGHVSVNSRGSGDVEVGRIGGDLDYDSAGSGDFDVDSVYGNSLSVSTRGSGDIEIDDGNVEMFHAQISGSASVRYGGETVNAKAKTNGSGDIYLHRPSGRLEQSEHGSGDIHISH